MSTSSQSRHVYTREERAILEASFARQSHPDIKEKERLAKLFNCNLIQISNWFQNHRRRVKKMNKSTATTSPKACSYPPQYTCYQPQYPCINYTDVSPTYYTYPSTSYSYGPSYYPQTMYEQVPPSYESFVPFYGYSESNLYMNENVGTCIFN